MSYLPEVVYNAADAVLTSAARSFTPELLKQFDTFVSHGTPAEDCCGLLTTYVPTFYPTTGVLQTEDIKGPYVWHADITLSLRECTPVMDGQNPPTPEQNDAYAKQTLIDIWGVVMQIMCDYADGKLFPGGICTFLIPPRAHVIEEQGACAGWDVDMSVELQESVIE